MSLASTAIAEMMCDAGYQWIAIDLEHSPTTLREAEALIQIIDAKGRTPLVRLSSNDAVQIKRVMDSGAHGVIVPMVTSQTDVDAAAQAMHYPPRKTRGVGLGRAQAYGEAFDAYRSWLAESAVLIAQIEHVDALDNLDAIFSHPALDAFFIGPYDLTASMGIAGQFDAEQYKDALERIREAGQRHGLCAGIHVVEPNPAELQARIGDGYRFVAYSVDFRMIAHACKLGVQAAND